MNNINQTLPRAFSLPSITPPLDRVLSRMGYNRKKSILDDNILSMVAKEIEYSVPLIKPSGRTLDCLVKKIEKGTVAMDCGIKFRSVKLSKIMANASRATLILCTIGNLLPGKTTELLNEGLMTRALITDAIGSEAVEAFADYITGVLKQERSLLRMKKTIRYSPGYGDLGTEVHKSMLPLLDSKSIGVSYLPDSFILIPEKTISAIIGWKSIGGR
jgi:hypothetical protein